MEILATIFDLSLCVLCVSFLVVISTILQNWGLWNGTMSMGSGSYFLLYILFPHHPFRIAGLLMYGLGVYRAMRVQNLRKDVSVGVALAASAIWFSFGLWWVVETFYYYCAGCIG